MQNDVAKGIQSALSFGNRFGCPFAGGSCTDRPVYCSVFPPPVGGGENNQRVWRKGRKRKEEKREKKENLGKI